MLAEAADNLPPPGPYLVGRSALKAKQTLEALRDLIDEALRDIDLYEKVSLSERRRGRGAAVNEREGEPV